MKIQVGELAPDFTLYDTEKKEVKLSSYEGKKVLLLFFPLAFTRTCTEELCSVRDSLTWFNAANTTVFGISVDSLHSLAKYKEEQKLNFSLLSDFNKEVSATYGSLYESFGYNMKGVSKRSAFVIDEKRLIRYAEILENAGQLPNFTRIRNILSARN